MDVVFIILSVVSLIITGVIMEEAQKPGYFWGSLLATLAFAALAVANFLEIKPLIYIGVIILVFAFLIIAKCRRKNRLY